jgi:Family of unknown function (DUF6194)
LPPLSVDGAVPARPSSCAHASTGGSARSPTVESRNGYLIITKDYPDDTASDLDPEGRWRVNVHVDRATFRRLTGEDPRGLTRPRDLATADVVNPHPVYGSLGWIAVVNPGERTADAVLQLLRDAHDAARARFERRQEEGGSPVR